MQGSIPLLPHVYHFVQDVKEAGGAWKLVVHQVDEVVAVCDVLDHVPGLRRLLVQLAPLLTPQAKRLVLRENMKDANLC